MRTYSIEISDVNDNLVAFWLKLDEDTMVKIITTIVPLRGYFLSVKIHLQGE